MTHGAASRESAAGTGDVDGLMKSANLSCYEIVRSSWRFSLYPPAQLGRHRASGRYPPVKTRTDSMRQDVEFMVCVVILEQLFAYSKVHRIPEDRKGFLRGFGRFGVFPAFCWGFSRNCRSFGIVISILRSLRNAENMIVSCVPMALVEWGNLSNISKTPRNYLASGME